MNNNSMENKLINSNNHFVQNKNKCLLDTGCAQCQCFQSDTAIKNSLHPRVVLHRLSPSVVRAALGLCNDDVHQEIKQDENGRWLDFLVSDTSNTDVISDKKTILTEKLSSGIAAVSSASSLCKHSGEITTRYAQKSSVGTKVLCDQGVKLENFEVVAESGQDVIKMCESINNEPENSVTKAMNPRNSQVVIGDHHKKTKRSPSMENSPTPAKHLKMPDALTKIATLPISQPIKQDLKSNLRYQLDVQMITLSDLESEPFRKFINLAADCALQFSKKVNSTVVQGSVSLYFGDSLSLQSALQKLTQLPKIADDAWIHCVIKCCEIKMDGQTGTEPWKKCSAGQMSFQFNTEKAERLRQLYTCKDRKREGTMRQSAKISRIPSAMNQEMLNLLFPFSLNIIIPETHESHLEYISGVQVEFESQEWMEAVLICCQQFNYIPSNANISLQLQIDNFIPVLFEKSQEKNNSGKPDNLHQRTLSQKKPDSNVKDKHGRSERSVPYNKTRSYIKDSNVKWDNFHQKTIPSSSPRSLLNKPESQKWQESDKTTRSFIYQKTSEDAGVVKKKESPTPGQNLNLQELAAKQGLDPNNQDVIRILEMSLHLETIQQQVQVIPHLPESKVIPPLPAPQVIPPSPATLVDCEDNFSQAEKVLRNNIESNIKRLLELEKKFKGKVKYNPSKCVLPDEKDGSEIILVRSTPQAFDKNCAQHSAHVGCQELRPVKHSTPEDPSRNNNPLDFNQSVNKISTEQAVSQDFKRTMQVFSKMKPGLPTVKEKYKEVEEMYLPVHFGKNATKTNEMRAYSEIKNDRTTDFGESQTENRKLKRYTAQSSDNTMSSQLPHLKYTSANCDNLNRPWTLNYPNDNSNVPMPGRSNDEVNKYSIKPVSNQPFQQSKHGLWRLNRQTDNIQSRSETVGSITNWAGLGEQFRSFRNEQDVPTKQKKWANEPKKQFQRSNNEQRSWSEQCRKLNDFPQTQRNNKSGLGLLGECPSHSVDYKFGQSADRFSQSNTKDRFSQSKAIGTFCRSNSIERFGQSSTADKLSQPMIGGRLGQSSLASTNSRSMESSREQFSASFPQSHHLIERNVSNAGYFEAKRGDDGPPRRLQQLPAQRGSYQDRQCNDNHFNANVYY